MKKIFITGATGFVGNHLAEQLLKEGHAVYILVRSPAKLNDFPLSGANIISGDLSDSKNSWVKDLPNDLDVVYHAAGVVHSISKKNFYRHNTRATEVLLNDLKNKYQEQPIHFVFLSSLAATGPSLQGRSVSEESKDIPVSHYGRSKLLAENYLKKHLPENFKLTIIRPPMVIGPRDLAILDIFKMVKGIFIVTPGLDGKNKEYSFVCVFDLVNALKKLLVIKVDRSVETFFIAHPKRTTFKNLIEEIQATLNKSFVIFIPIPISLIKIIARFLRTIYPVIRHDLRLTRDKVKELAPSSWCCDSGKSVKLLDMRYQYDLKKTLELTGDDYENRRWI